VSSVNPARRACGCSPASRRGLACRRSHAWTSHGTKSRQSNEIVWINAMIFAVCRSPTFRFA
jgi:hypothetical protein